MGDSLQFLIMLADHLRGRPTMREVSFSETPDLMQVGNRRPAEVVEGEVVALLPLAGSEQAVSFRQACMNRFAARAIVGCQHTKLWRTRESNPSQPDPWSGALPLS